MTDWFRSWHGAPTDAKWRTIAKRAKVAPSLVVAVAWALMDRASQAEARGSIEGLDVETLGDFLACESEEIEAIISAMRHKGMLTENTFTAWDKRQPQREDGSAERAKAWREQKRFEKILAEKEAEIRRLKAAQTVPNEADREQTEGGEGEQKRPLDDDCERSRTQPNAKKHRVEENREDNYAALRERERARFDRLEADLRQAAGLENVPSPGLFDLAPILGLVDAGFDVEHEILPVIRAKRRKGRVVSWAYFVEAIHETRVARSHAGVARNHPRDGPAPRSTRGAASALAGIESFHRTSETVD